MLKISLIVASIAFANALNCAVNDYDKSDCGAFLVSPSHCAFLIFKSSLFVGTMAGFVGIDQAGCEAKSCCWAASSVSGTPWCFRQAGASASCYAMQSALAEPFSAEEVKTMRGYFLANININGNGGIVAAPGILTLHNNFDTWIFQICFIFSFFKRLQHSWWFVLLPLDERRGTDHEKSSRNESRKFL